MSVDIIVLLQVLVQGTHLSCQYLLTEASPKMRLIAFSALTASNIPGAYILYSSELYVYLATVPVWTLINLRGIFTSLKLLENEK